MKKLLALFMAISICLTLAACSSSDWSKTLKEYEDVNYEYIDFIQTYNALSAEERAERMEEYTEALRKLTEVVQKLNGIEEGLSGSDLEDFIADKTVVDDRIEEKAMAVNETNQ